jgi:hypothetical protein
LNPSATFDIFFVHHGLAEARMDSQTAVVFVLVTILTFLFALRETPKSDIELRNRRSHHRLSERFMDGGAFSAETSPVHVCIAAGSASEDL